MDSKIGYKKIVESLKLLALPFEDQKKCFPEFVDVPFEVLDTFDKVFYILPDIVENQKLKFNSIANLIRLKNLIDFTSSNPKLRDLDVEQFSKSEEWEKIRSFAKEIISELGEELAIPDSNFI